MASRRSLPPARRHAWCARTRFRREGSEGETGKLAGKIVRIAGFNQPVTVTLTATDSTGHIGTDIAANTLVAQGRGLPMQLSAADVLRGRRKAPGVKWAIVVPGSGLVKEQAEAEGLDKVFTDAGLEWREPGCSACLGMNPDKVPPGERCASTSNRNFVGRQGPGARTHLVSPAMAAAAAVTGKLTDVRALTG